MFSWLIRDLGQEALEMGLVWMLLPQKQRSARLAVPPSAQRPGWEPHTAIGSGHHRGTERILHTLRQRGYRLLAEGLY